MNLSRSLSRRATGPNRHPSALLGLLARARGRRERLAALVPPAVLLRQALLRKREAALQARAAGQERLRLEEGRARLGRVETGVAEALDALCGRLLVGRETAGRTKHLSTMLAGGEEPRGQALETLDRLCSGSHLPCALQCRASDRLDAVCCSGLSVVAGLSGPAALRTLVTCLLRLRTGISSGLLGLILSCDALEDGDFILQVPGILRSECAKESIEVVKIIKEVVPDVEMGDIDIAALQYSCPTMLKILGMEWVLTDREVDNFINRIDSSKTRHIQLFLLGMLVIYVKKHCFNFIEKLLKKINNDRDVNDYYTKMLELSLAISAYILLIEELERLDIIMMTDKVYIWGKNNSCKEEDTYLDSKMTVLKIFDIVGEVITSGLQKLSGNAEEKHEKIVALFSFVLFPILASVQSLSRQVSVLYTEKVACTSTNGSDLNSWLNNKKENLRSYCLKMCDIISFYINQCNITFEKYGLIMDKHQPKTLYATYLIEFLLEPLYDTIAISMCLAIDHQIGIYVFPPLFSACLNSSDKCDFIHLMALLTTTLDIEIPSDIHNLFLKKIQNELGLLPLGNSFRPAIETLCSVYKLLHLSQYEIRKSEKDNIEHFSKMLKDVLIYLTNKPKKVFINGTRNNNVFMQSQRERVYSTIKCEITGSSVTLKNVLSVVEKLEIGNADFMIQWTNIEKTWDLRSSIKYLYEIHKKVVLVGIFDQLLYRSRIIDMLSENDRKKFIGESIWMPFQCLHRCISKLCKLQHVLTLTLYPSPLFEQFLLEYGVIKGYMFFFLLLWLN